MLHPRLIVADEPVSMIDASLRANVLAQIQALRDDLGISIIYITHDIATARAGERRGVRAQPRQDRRARQRRRGYLQPPAPSTPGCSSARSHAPIPI